MTPPPPIPRRNYTLWYTALKTYLRAAFGDFSLDWQRGIHLGEMTKHSQHWFQSDSELTLHKILLIRFYLSVGFKQIVLKSHTQVESTAMSHKNKVHLLSGWVRLSAIVNSSSFSSAVACRLSSLDRVTLRSPGPTWSSTLVSCTTTDTSPLPQADLNGTEWQKNIQPQFHDHIYLSV